MPDLSFGTRRELKVNVPKALLASLSGINLSKLPNVLQKTASEMIRIQNFLIMILNLLKKTIPSEELYSATLTASAVLTRLSETLEKAISGQRPDESLIVELDNEIRKLEQVAVPASVQKKLRELIRRICSHIASLETLFIETAKADLNFDEGLESQIHSEINEYRMLEICGVISDISTGPIGNHEVYGGILGKTNSNSEGVYRFWAPKGFRFFICLSVKSKPLFYTGKLDTDSMGLNFEIIKT